jgi:hypothetical protein
MINRFLACAVVIIAGFCRVAHADPESGFGFGVHGFNNSLYGVGSPQLKWVINGNNALEFTPTLFGINYDVAQHQVTEDFGLNIAYIHGLGRYGSLHLNALFEVGYERKSNRVVSTYKVRYDYLRLGVGPDLEYFFPSAPNISLGARIVVRGTHETETVSISPNPTRRYIFRTLQLDGEALNVHYYFGDSKSTRDSEVGSPARFALGVQGIGTMYGNGNPNLTWILSPTYSLELTPIFSGQKLMDSPSHVSDNNSDRWGLNVTVTRLFMAHGGLRIGGLFEVAYAHSYSHYPDPTVYQNYKSHQDTVDIGFGPDFEYFIPAVPNLSIDARCALRYTYSQTKGYHNGGGFSETISQAEELVGQGLTLRYYFGGKSESRRPAKADERAFDD